MVKRPNTRTNLDKAVVTKNVDWETIYNEVYAAFNARMNVSIRRLFRVFNFMQISMVVNFTAIVTNVYRNITANHGRADTPGPPQL